MRKKILIVEDHDIYRYGLKITLTKVYGDSVILEAEDFPTAQQTIAQHPDLSFVLLDICLPGTRGLEGLRALRAAYPLLTLIVISSLDFHESIDQVIASGANGFLSKSTSKEQMQQAISAILRGEVVVASEHSPTSKIQLSKRQTEILVLLSKGMANKQIAEKLCISDSTVKEHVSNILEALSVDNRIGAALIAQKRGITLDH